ncbi:hypothetical protein AB7813_03655 [Tardiphaga sp. 20_F10_N6_6]|uniref:hypothetical protein n=1 Tax=Tardiphaga TaxID=1395974 RepID=UPI001586653F|nr:hypothetical protein [Tardiphaga robiniae]NUU44555.1 hypothetical protein [Tardiphaga robiniae]
MLSINEIVQHDDGAWFIGWHDDAPGPFGSRQHAEAVALVQNRPVRKLSPHEDPART